MEEPQSEVTPLLEVTHQSEEPQLEVTPKLEEPQAEVTPQEVLMPDQAPEDNMMPQSSTHQLVELNPSSTNQLLPTVTEELLMPTEELPKEVTAAEEDKEPTTMEEDKEPTTEDNKEVTTTEEDNKEDLTTTEENSHTFHKSQLPQPHTQEEKPHNQ